MGNAAARPLTLGCVTGCHCVQYKSYTPRRTAPLLTGLFWGLCKERERGRALRHSPPLIMSSHIILTLSCLVAASLAQGGGMAELKAITGDAPYSGTGNVPAPIPQPMGFWGRPRYSPMGFGASPYWGGYDGAYYGPDRFTSIGHSPYGGPGPIRSRPFNSPDDSLFTAMMSFLDGASSPFDSRPSPRRFNPTNPSFSSPTVSQQPVIPHSPSSLQPSPGSSFSLSSATGGGGGLGGFYKGHGN